MDSEHTGLIFHSEFLWLSRGTLLIRLFELRYEVHLFLKNMTPLSSHFEDEAWLCRLAYLTDIFSKLNGSNLNLQGNRSNIFSMEDKVRGFYRKLLVWQRRVKSGNLAAFPTMLDLLDNNDRNEPPAGTQSHITQHLENLSQQFLSYYPFFTEDSYGGNDWIFSPFIMDAVSKAKIKDDLQHNN
jgi:hypothetical protein